MFRISQWCALGLLSLAMYALWLHLFSVVSSHAEKKEGGQHIAQEATSTHTSPYMQYRQELRRDLYEGKGTARRHAFYTAKQAETMWQKKGGELEEHLTQCTGVLYEDTGELRIHSAQATCLSHPMTLLMNAVKCMRTQEGKDDMSMIAEKAVWRFPQEQEHKELSCEGHVQLDAPPLKIKGQRLCWHENQQLLCLDGALDGALAYVEYAPVAEMLLNLTAEHIALTYDAKKHPVHIEAERQVNCHYRTALHSKAYGLHATGDRIQVHAHEHIHEQAKGQQEKPPTYQIALESTTEKPCHVEIEQGFQGTAQSFQYNTALLRGEAHDLKGMLDLDLEGKVGRLGIKADHLTWDGEQLRLTLEGNILLSLYEDQESNCEPFCTLTASNRLICACLAQPRLCCHKIQVEGPMQLNHIVWGKLTGCGVMLIDCLKNKMIARGLQGSTGAIPLENQVRLETVQGKIQGDRLALDLYREDVQGFSLHAQGLVGIEGAQGQYALAHEMHYDTRSHQGQLLGSPLQRVLFWEPRYDVRLSAPSCRFTLRDPETGKIKVQGNGDVRMTFFDMERKKLQTRFPSYER